MEYHFEVEALTKKSRRVTLARHGIHIWAFMVFALSRSQSFSICAAMQTVQTPILADNECRHFLQMRLCK